MSIVFWGFSPWSLGPHCIEPGAAPLHHGEMVQKRMLIDLSLTQNSLLASKSHRVPPSLPWPQCLDYIHIAVYCFYRCWGPQLRSPSYTISNKEEEWESDCGLRILIRTIHHDVRPLMRSHFLKIAPFPTTPQVVTMIVAVGLWGMVAIQAKALYGGTH